MRIQELKPLRTDPSRTVTLRRLFWSRLRGGYNNVKKAVRQKVLKEDALGLRPTKTFVALNNLWAHLPDNEKIDQFMFWLDEQVKANLIEVDWHRKLIDSSYRKGLVRAFQDTRKDRKAIQSEAFFDGTKAEFIEQSFNQPQTLETIAVVFGQSFESLKNINAAMAANIRRTLATELTRGSAIDVVSKALFDEIDNISRNRARLIAQTEVIRAHAEGQLDAFQKLGVEELGAMVEYSTAGDGRVCPRCASLNGKKYSVKEARGIIPLHPGCRCTWIPYIPQGEKE